MLSPRRKKAARLCVGMHIGSRRLAAPILTAQNIDAPEGLAKRIRHWICTNVWQSLSFNVTFTPSPK